MKAIFILFLLLMLGCESADQQIPQLPSTDSQKTIFTDITEAAGLNFVHDPAVEGNYHMPESIGAGGALFDYNNDGNLDVYLINGAYRKKNTVVQNRLFRQEADHRFRDVTETAGIGDSGYGMGAAIGDINNDGDIDLYIANDGQDALYQNNGDGTFKNITQAAGIDNSAWGSSAALFDFDLDGWLDIYVANYVKYNPATVCTDKAGRPDYCGPGGFPGLADKLFRNRGDGSFQDVSDIAGIGKFPGRSLGVISADFNGDFFPDIYVANDGESNQLWINQGDGSFQDQALLLGAAMNEMGYMEAGMGIAIGDCDNDGDNDLFVTHLRGESNTFYRNIGETGFQDDTGPAGLEGISLPYTGFGTGFLDYDHDGDLDLALVNGRVTRGPLLTKTGTPGFWDHYAEPNFLFENLGNGIFTENKQTLSFSGRVENSRGLLFGDIDNDGDRDMLVTNEGGPARIYRNDYPGKGHWLTVRIYDAKLKRDAIGASVTLFAGDLKLTREVRSAYSFQSASDLRVHFGLGNTTTIDRIEVRWPGGHVDIFRNVTVDQIITLQKQV